MPRSPLSMSPEARARFLEDPYTGVLAIDRPGPDEPPLLAPVWYVVDDDGSLLVNTGSESEKATLAARAGRASLCVHDDSVPQRFVTVAGEVVAEPSDAAIQRRLAERYLPAELVEPYLASTEGAETVLLRLRPSRAWSNDFSKLAI